MTACRHNLTAVRDFGYPWQYEECLECGWMRPGDGGDWRYALTLFKPNGKHGILYAVDRRTHAR